MGSLDKALNLTLLSPNSKLIQGKKEKSIRNIGLSIFKEKCYLYTQNQWTRNPNPCPKISLVVTQNHSSFLTFLLSVLSIINKMHQKKRLKKGLCGICNNQIKAYVTKLEHWNYTTGRFLSPNISTILNLL